MSDNLDIFVYAIGSMALLGVVSYKLLGLSPNIRDNGKGTSNNRTQKKSSSFRG